jgi:DNA-binding CsgD family transcriptional regulator
MFIATFFAHLTDYRRLFIFVSMVSGILCFVCLEVPSVLDTSFGLFGSMGAVLFSFFTITSWLLWFQIISRLPIMATAIVITVSIAIASVLTWLLVGIYGHRLLLILVIIIALSSLTLVRAIREQGNQALGEKSIKTAERSHTRLPIGLFVVTFCFGVAYMYTTSLTSLEAFHSNFNWDLAVFSLALIIAILVLSRRITVAALFSIAAPITIGSILLTLLPNVAHTMTSSLFNIGFFTYLAFIIILSCGIIQEQRGDPSRLFFLLVLSSYIGCFVGRLLFPAIDLLFTTQVEYYRTILALAMILLLVICTTLCLRATYRLFGNRTHDPHYGFTTLPKHGGISCEQAKESFDLSDRETEVLALLLEGKSATLIAQEMIIAQGTAKAHIGNVYKKMGVHNREELFRMVSHNN